MSLELALIFLNVVTPVFGPVLLGYLSAKPLQLEARTLSRAAYYLLVHDFTFNVMSSAELAAAQALQMVGYMLLVTLGMALLGVLTGRLLRRPASVVAAYLLIAIFGNVGNFGFPLIEFGLGEAALPAATVYFLVITFVSFVLGVAAANYVRGGNMAALLAVFKTPALLALVPALIVNWFDWPLPLVLTRIIGLLAGAMIPVMLIALGVQLAQTRSLRLSYDLLVATALRLLGGPLLAFLLITPFTLDETARGAGIMQASMPAAVLTSIIALEYDLEPEFVTHAVLFSTLVSVVTLTILLTII